MKYGQWCYSFKFLEGIRLHWLFHAGFGEVRFLFDANSWFFSILKWFRDGFPLFKLIFSFLKLKRILKKIDISGVNCICINLTQIVGRFDIWVTTKTNRPSFCLILTLSHVLDGLFSVYYLGCMVVNIKALSAEWSITERDYFQILLLGILSSLERPIYFKI